MRLRQVMSMMMVVALFLGFNAVNAAETPEQVVQKTSDQMLSALKQNKAVLNSNPDKIYDLVEKILVPRFDFGTISQWTMGRTWRTATPAQRTRFTNEFKRLLINSYAGTLLEYSDEKVRILPGPSSVGKNEVTVRSEIVSAKRAPVAVNYSMILSSNNHWMVYDVVIEGVSIVTSYRSEVRELVASQGIDGMINAIAQKNKAK